MLLDRSWDPLPGFYNGPKKNLRTSFITGYDSLLESTVSSLSLDSVFSVIFWFFRLTESVKYKQPEVVIEHDRVSLILVFSVLPFLRPICVRVFVLT